MSKKITISALGFVLLLVVFELGVLVGVKVNRPQSSSPAQNSNNTYQAGWDAAKKRIQEKGIGGLPSGMEIKNVSGTIDSIAGNVIVLKNVASLDPLADPALDTRTIQVATDTKIYELTQQDPLQFQKELLAFTKAMRATTSTAPSMPPSMLVKNTSTLEALKIGQTITVSANNNICDQPEFVASEISVQSVAALPDQATSSPVQ